MSTFAWFCVIGFATWYFYDQIKRFVQWSLRNPMKEPQEDDLTRIIYYTGSPEDHKKAFGTDCPKHTLGSDCNCSERASTMVSIQRHSSARSVQEEPEVNSEHTAFNNGAQHNEERPHVSFNSPNTTIADAKDGTTRANVSNVQQTGDASAATRRGAAPSKPQPQKAAGDHSNARSSASTAAGPVDDASRQTSSVSRDPRDNWCDFDNDTGDVPHGLLGEIPKELAF